MSLHVDVIPNRKSRPAILREYWREGKRIRQKTLSNLSHLPPHIMSEPTALQQRAFELLGVEPGRFVSSTSTG